MTTSNPEAGTGRATTPAPKQAENRVKSKTPEIRVSKDTVRKVPSNAESDLVSRARWFRHRMKLDNIDYYRILVRLKEVGHTQQQLARELAISQPSVSSVLKKAQTVPAPREGFAGADPYEVCQRYSVGELTREEVISELTRWEYTTPDDHQHDDCDDLRFSTPGSFDDVVRAFDDGLIGDDVYDAVLAWIHRCGLGNELIPTPVGSGAFG